MRAFFIVGPTASGKSELAAEVAAELDGEIVSADAFQLYAGLDLLTAKPEPHLLARVRHHLVGCFPLAMEMNVEAWRGRALAAIGEINARGKPAFVVGGNGLYVKALTHGLSPMPPADPALRAELQSLSTEQLHAQLAALDPAGAATIDRHNPHRLLRALEICRLTNAPLAAARTPPTGETVEACGVLLLREREELRERIDQRVESIFAQRRGRRSPRGRRSRPDRREDARARANPCASRWQNFRGGVHRRDPAGDPAVCQKAIDLVSRPKYF